MGRQEEYVPAQARFRYAKNVADTKFVMASHLSLSADVFSVPSLKHILLVFRRPPPS